MTDTPVTVDELNAMQAELDRQKANLMVGKIDEALMELTSADIDNLANTLTELASGMVNGNSKTQMMNTVSMIRTMPNILNHERSTFNAVLNPPTTPGMVTPPPMP
jgi:hypothetical protein